MARMFRRRRQTPRAQAPTVRPDWRSYDSVAEDYERVRTTVHEPPARDLVALLAASAASRVLDVGTGTGVAAAAAREANPDAVVVGVDRSVPMLRLARARGVERLAAVDAIDLPFRDGTFDAVSLVFVLHLVTRPETVLYDVDRVLRHDGRLGIATWGGGDDEFTRTWRAIAESYATKEMLADALERAAPSRDRFSDRGKLQETLRVAGLRDVRVEERTYRSTVSIEDYLVGRETTVLGRFLREMLGERLWERFRERVRDEFRARFREPLGDSNEVLLAVGVKP